MAIPSIPERWVRHIWQHQLFTTQDLHSSHGAPVRILTPGIPNLDGGPDFTDASIRIGTTIFHGDVEIHRSAVEWHQHHHGTDPHYNRVILHVVLTAEPIVPPARTASHRILPLLVLHPFLDPEVERVLTESFPGRGTGAICELKCRNLTGGISSGVLNGWLRRLALERMEVKVRLLEDRLKQLIDEDRSGIREPYPRYYGDPGEIPAPMSEYSHAMFADSEPWEQLLFEGVMEGLGYEKNRIPFRLLAQSLRLKTLREFRFGDTQTMMALLFGTAGLLPSPQKLQEHESRRYVRALRRRWRELRPQIRWPLLHEGDWLFFRLRPGNFPTARLAALCFLLPALFGEGCFRRLLRRLKEPGMPVRRRIAALHNLFTFLPDEFWKRHVHFRGARPSSRTTLGIARVNDLLVNTIIPLTLLYARIFKDHAVGKHALQILASLGAAQDNRVTRAIQVQVIGHPGTLSSALLQQGAMQLYKSYCSAGRCAECTIGRRLVLPHVSPGSPSSR